MGKVKTVTKLFVLFASTILCASAWAQVSSIAVGSGSGLPGATGIVVPVNLTANGDNIAGIDMRVTFTTASQYSLITVDCGAQTVSGNVFPSCSVAANVVTIQLAETGGQPWVSGLLANITVDIDGAAVPTIDDPLAARRTEHLPYWPARNLIGPPYQIQQLVWILARIPWIPVPTHWI